MQQEKQKNASPSPRSYKSPGSAAAAATQTPQSEPSSLSPETGKRLFLKGLTADFYAEASTPHASLAVSSLDFSASAVTAPQRAGLHEGAPQGSEVGGEHTTICAAPNEHLVNKEKFGWSEMMAWDGDGAILREIMSFFIVLDNDPLEAAAKDCLSRRDILSASATCRILSQATDLFFSMLLLPNGAINCCPPDELESAPASLIRSRPNLATFMARPERRLRSHTASDTRGRQILDSLYGNPVFCVRYRGIRQGNILHASTGPERSRAASIATGVWPLQLHTYFKMRTYTRFERLMGVYAERSHLPLRWLNFEITDKLHGMPVDPKTGITLPNATLPTIHAMEPLPTNNGRMPLLGYGHGISASHSLWTIGVEPGDGGMNQARITESTASLNFSSSSNTSTTSESVPEAPLGDHESSTRNEDLNADDGNIGLPTQQTTYDNFEAPAYDEEEHEEEEEEQQQQQQEEGQRDDENNDEEDTPSSLQDVWVDSYLTCSTDECYVCVRDMRSNRSPSAIPEFMRGNDARRCSSYPECGYFGGDSNNLPFATNEADPGQPVRPPHTGWLFKVKANAPLDPIFQRVCCDITGSLADGILPVTQAFIHRAADQDLQSSTVEPLSDSLEEAAAQAEERSSDDASNVFMEASTERSSIIASTPTSGPKGPSVSRMLLQFVAVAPQFSECFSKASPLDTPVIATARAAGLILDARFRRRPHPVHILEVHDLVSYVTLLRNRRNA